MALFDFIKNRQDIYNTTNANLSSFDKSVYDVFNFSKKLHPISYILGSIPTGFYERKASQNLLKDTFKDQLIAKLKAAGIANDSAVFDYVNSLPEDTLYSLAENNGLLNEDNWLWGKYNTSADWDEISNLFKQLADNNTPYPDEVTYETVSSNVRGEVNDLYDKLIKSVNDDEERQTNLFKDQLQENANAFNDYRQQILGNQYQQNAALLGTVNSEMSRSRRNALEAGASAGLRLAENINTTMALQNKQSQTSLETSNQLAQALLNQRQAAAGIRSNYSNMLSDTAAQRRQYNIDKDNTYYNRLQSAWDVQSNKNTENYNKYADSFDRENNPYADSYLKYTKSQSQYNK